MIVFCRNVGRFTLHRVVVFLNHRAGQHHRSNWVETIRLALFRSEITFVSLMDKNATEDAIAKLKNSAYDTAITIGGDGTIHSIIQQVVGTSARFLVLPGGTANDLSTQIGHHQKLECALELVRQDTWSYMDLVDVNGVLMATNGGIGLVGNVAASVERYRQRVPAFLSLMSHLGHRIYSTVLGVKLIRGDTEPYKVEVKSKEFNGVVETPILLINNQPYLAGSFPVAPQTNNQDGKFNVTIFFHRKLVDLALAIDRVRRHIPPVYDPNIISFETEEVQIKNLDDDSLTDFFGDGESMGSSRVFKARIIPHALRILSSSPPSHSQSPQTCSKVTL